MYLKSAIQPVVGQASPRFCWRNCLKFLCASMLLLAKPQREKLWQNKKKSQRTVVSVQLDPSHFTIFVTLCWMCTSMSVSLELGSPGLDAAHEIFFTIAEQSRIISLDLLAKLFLMQPKKLFTFLEAKVHCGCVFNYVSSARCFSANQPSVLSAPSISWHMRLFFLSCRTRHFSLFEHHDFLVSPFLKPIGIPLDGSTNIWSINHSYLLQTCCGCTVTPSSRSLVKKLNNTGPDIKTIIFH